jgi:hypothetical protein
VIRIIRTTTAHISHGTGWMTTKTRTKSMRAFQSAQGPIDSSTTPVASPIHAHREYDARSRLVF